MHHIVSRDRGSIQTLCKRAVLLEKGTVIKGGKPEEVMDFYNALIAKKVNAMVRVGELQNGSIQTRSGSGDVSIESVTLHDAAADPIEYLSVGEHVSLLISTRVTQRQPGVGRWLSDQGQTGAASAWHQRVALGLQR